MEITLVNRQRKHAVARDRLVGFLERLAHTLPPKRAGSLGVNLVSDTRIREYNRDFRGIDRATDVLSFPTDEPVDPDGGCHLGDIVVSVTTAAVQAGERQHSLEREIEMLLLHGYLHLLGYDHETDEGQMMELQRELATGLLSGEGRRT